MTPADPASPALPASISGSTYGPITHFLSREDEPDATARLSASARLGFKVRNDTYLLVAIALAIPVLVLEAAGRGATSLGLLGPIVFVASQLWLASHSLCSEQSLVALWLV